MSIKPDHITLFEHQNIRVGQKQGEVEFTESHRQALEAHYGSGKMVKYFSLIHRGVQFNEFVGVIQVGNLVIEVLPKADKYEKEAEWKGILIGMLRAVGVFDIQAPSSSSLNIKTNFILDLYFGLFVKEVEYLVNEGLAKKYRRIEGNATALKGALQFGKHIAQNLVHQERFYIKYTIYDQNHNLNQILLKTLRLLIQVNQNPMLQSRIGSLLLHFPEMPNMKVTEATFDRIHFNRKTERYRNAIEISRLLLLNYHPDVSKGQNNVLAIMFDMNLLWERFIYLSLRKHNPDNRSISAQTSKYFWKPKKGNRSSIIPDIVIDEKGQETIVLDTKWKNIGSSNPSPDDLRQLYVYHKYFDAQRVALVYPGNEEDRTGQYYNTDQKSRKDNENMSDDECSVIKIETKNNISEWQKAISHQIFQAWPSLIEKEL